MPIEMPTELPTEMPTQSLPCPTPVAPPTTAGPSCAEFFAGIGLVRLGLESAGWSVAFANDIDKQKREMYGHHFGADHADPSDVHELDPGAVPTVDLATASFPCTDLSLAGGRLGLGGSHSSAFWGFRRVLAGMGARRPPLVLIENVTGFLTSHGGKDFEAALLALNELGYAIDPFVLDARWFVPQSRPRLFVIGVLSGSGTPPGPLTHTRLRPKPVVDFIQRHPSIRWRLRSLPEPPTRSPLRLDDVIEDLPPDSPFWWSQDRADYLFNQMSDRHHAVAERMVRARRWSYGTVFRRVRQQADGVKRSMAELRTDGVAGCLRTPRGGSGRQILFKAGYGRYAARLLTPTECARLMGAGGFRIDPGATLNQSLFGFGDAVCVPAITWIATNYLNPVLDELALLAPPRVMPFIARPPVPDPQGPRATPRRGVRVSNSR